MRRFFSVFILFFVIVNFTYAAKPPKYLDANVPIEKRVDDLLSKMTVEEKVAQLQCNQPKADEKPMVPANGLGQYATVLRAFNPAQAAEEANRIQKMARENTRLGIPVIIHDEGLHGLIGLQATSFPQAIGLASTWNPQLMEKAASVIAEESKTRGIHQLLSPVINIARDVRWGRVEETYGEDPYLTSQMAVAYCKALAANGVIATPKHFAVNVGDGGRDSYPIHYSERLLREIYFPAFKACVQQGKAQSLMAAYNSIDGRACSANRWLLTKVLREEWGFDGFVVSDYGSAIGIMKMHNNAGSLKEAAKMALDAGMDSELSVVEIFGDDLISAVKEGYIPKQILNKAVRRILTVKYSLGLFDNPYVDPNKAQTVSADTGHSKLALEAARQSIVLLKNDGTLPLSKDVNAVALFGPNVDVPQLGGYSGWPQRVVTLLAGVKEKVGEKTAINYFKDELDYAGFQAVPAEYLIPADACEGEHGLRAEFYNNVEMTGKPALSRIDKKIDFVWDKEPAAGIKADRFAILWKGKLAVPVSREYEFSITSDDGCRIFIDGKKVVDKWIDGTVIEKLKLTLEANKQYDIRIEYYENAGKAEFKLAWKADFDEYVSKAVAMAKKSKAAIVVAGVREGENMDRAKLDLPDLQQKLIMSLTDAGVPTIVVLINGSAITMEGWIDKVSAVLEAWYPGQEGGYAVADIIFGDCNPSGKLPITFPRYVGQLPLYYNYKPSGRGYDYVDMSGKPLFAFGHGLSYTKFEYNNIKLSSEKIKASDNIVVSADIKNVGSRKGDEVVQLYLRDEVSSYSRPLKELQGFERVSLEPGESKTVTFKLSQEQLSLLDENLKPVVEPGFFEVMIGSSSDDIRQKIRFEVVAKAGNK